MIPFTHRCTVCADRADLGHRPANGPPQDYSNHPWPDQPDRKCHGAMVPATRCSSCYPTEVVA